MQFVACNVAKLELDSSSATIAHNVARKVHRVRALRISTSAILTSAILKAEKALGTRLFDE